MSPIIYCIANSINKDLNKTVHSFFNGFAYIAIFYFDVNHCYIFCNTILRVMHVSAERNSLQTIECNSLPLCRVRLIFCKDNFFFLDYVFMNRYFFRMLIYKRIKRVLKDLNLSYAIFLNDFLSVILITLAMKYVYIYLCLFTRKRVLKQYFDNLCNVL